jgi:hypothetical protein
MIDRSPACITPARQRSLRSAGGSPSAPQVRHSETVSSVGCAGKECHLILRLAADSFPRLLSISYSTACPSFSELRPARSTADYKMWTNTSLPQPPEG